MRIRPLPDASRRTRGDGARSRSHRPRTRRREPGRDPGPPPTPSAGGERRTRWPPCALARKLAFHLRPPRLRSPTPRRPSPARDRVRHHSTHDDRCVHARIRPAHHLLRNPMHFGELDARRDPDAPQIGGLLPASVTSIRSDVGHDGRSLGHFHHIGICEAGASGGRVDRAGRPAAPCLQARTKSDFLDDPRRLRVGISTMT